MFGSLVTHVFLNHLKEGVGNIHAGGTDESSGFLGWFIASRSFFIIGLSSAGDQKSSEDEDEEWLEDFIHVLRIGFIFIFIHVRGL